MATRPEGRRIQPLYIVLGVVVVVAVAALIFLNQAGDDPIEIPTPEPGTGQAAAPQPTPSPEPLEVFEIFEGKDPFRPLITEPAAGAPPGPGEETPGPGATATPPGATPPPGTPAPTQPPSVMQPPSATQPPAQATPRPADKGGVHVRVLDVADDSSSATVAVNGRTFENARRGQTLSDGVRITGIADPCVAFARDGEGFTLCEGESALK